jgi:membrane-bound metal-dependent hydrolase YbcI (DUF457 family)
VILWFAAFAVLGAWAVLRDPAFDYRLVALGALLPDVVDAPAGHRALAHTLGFAVGLLVLVMLGTVNRRSLRRHLIALPIGCLAHLVLDGVWAAKSLFWWPAFGTWGATALVPAPGVAVIRELLGLGAAVLVARRFGLGAADARRGFVRTGTLTPC